MSVESLDCPELARLFGELDNDDEAADRIAAHIDTCESCRGAELWLSTVLQQYSAGDDRELPPEIEDWMMERLCPSRN